MKKKPIRKVVRKVKPKVAKPVPTLPEEQEMRWNLWDKICFRLMIWQTRFNIRWALFRVKFKRN